MASPKTLSMSGSHRNDLLTSAIGAMENGLHRRFGHVGCRSHAKEAVRCCRRRAGKDPGCGADGCLAKGSVATPATVKEQTDYWAGEKYK